MQRIDNHSYSQPNQCQSFKCSYNASNYCRSHLQILCSGCSLVFHLDWDIKTTNGKELWDVSIGILNDVTYKLSMLGFKYGLDKYWVDYEDSVRRIVETVNDLQQRYEEFEINIMNEDGYIKEWRKVVRDVLESQAYLIINLIIKYI